MRNNSNTKKKTQASAPNIEKQKQYVPVLQPKIKDFKIEIDHEIAKCLDTLDRQGLKYLKETIRSSMIFELMEQKQLAEKEQKKQKEQIKQAKGIKKSQSSKKEVQKETKKSPSKKGISRDKTKKTHTTKTNPSKISGHTKKTSKVGTQQQTNIQKAKKPKDEEQIQEQICQEWEINEDIDIQEPCEPSINEVTQLAPNITKSIKQEAPQSIRVSPSKYRPEKPIAEPIRPFSKKAQRESSNRNLLKPSVYIVDEQKKEEEQEEKQISNKNEIDLLVNKIINLSEDKRRELTKIIDRLQIAPEELSNSSSARPYIFNNISHSKSGVSSRCGTANNKSRKNTEKATSLFQPIMKHHRKDTLELRDRQKKIVIQEPDQEFNINGEQNQEQEEIIEEMFEEAHQLPPSQQLSINQTDTYRNAEVHEPITEMSQSIRQSSIERRGGESRSKKKSSLFQKLTVGSNVLKKPLDIEITESHQIDTVDLDQMNKRKSANQEDQSEPRSNSSRMMKLGKKKLGTNLVQIRLVRNRGHPSIIGLTGIEMYNFNKSIIPISVNNIITPSGIKVIKLFNGKNLTVDEQNMYTCKLKENGSSIELEIPEKIGGIKVWNYNKSQIESTKQTDQLEISINSKVVWSGSIKKGSYNQLKEYATEIILDNGFTFAIPEQSQHITASNYSDPKLTPPKNQHKALDLKIKTNQQKAAEWLQQTMLAKQILQKQVEQQKVSGSPQRKQIKNAKVAQNSPFKTIDDSLGISDIGFRPKKLQIRHRESDQLKQQVQIQEALKTKSRTDFNKIKPKNKGLIAQKPAIEKQTDIFASLLQSKNDFKKKQEIVKQPIRQKTEESSQKSEIKYLGEVEYEIDENFGKQKPDKKMHEKSLDDFMNDSLFQEPGARVSKNKSKQTITRTSVEQAQDKNYMKQKPIQIKEKDDLNLSQFINELDQLVGGDGGKQNKYKYGDDKKRQIKIPELPKGALMQLVIFSNWGDSQNVGISRLQFFDQNGFQVSPVSIPNVMELQKSVNQGSMSVVEFIKNSSRPSDDIQNSPQLIFKRQFPVSIKLQFSKPVEFSSIRIGNYLGDRVHASRGLRKISINIDSAMIFSGEIIKSSSSSAFDIHNYETILLTNNKIVQKKIVENDWLYQEFRRHSAQMRNERKLFKKTLEGFHRPETKGYPSQKQINIVEEKRPIKMPKRQCFQFDPPILPSGYYVKLVIHSTWGDRNFVGLNGIVIYGDKGNPLPSSHLKIKEFPASLSSLPGYEKDQRRPQNLLNAHYFSDKPEDTWLAVFTSDLQKMDKKPANSLLIQLPGCTTISAINVYNYTKDPQRGVKEIQVFMDHNCLYRGYIRRGDLNEYMKDGQSMTHTSIGLTKDVQILEKIMFMGYHQDNQEQEVVFINENRVMGS